MDPTSNDNFVKTWLENKFSQDRDQYPSQNINKNTATFHPDSKSINFLSLRVDSTKMELSI